MDELRDLVPRRDPKGGSPRTPSTPIPLKTYEQYVANGNGNGTIWKVATSGFASLLVGMTIAWFTALQSKGVNQKEVQEYMDKYSPYAHDKEMLALQNQNQDKDIGALNGFKDRIFDRLNKIEKDISDVTRDVSEHDKKIKTIADYMEAERTTKR